jgi:hypothetical protein
MVKSSCGGLYEASFDLIWVCDLGFRFNRDIGFSREESFFILLLTFIKPPYFYTEKTLPF